MFQVIKHFIIMKIYLTKEGHSKLLGKHKKELKNLKQIRKEKSISWSDDGDGIHDNPIYHTFKEKESVQLSNIDKINQILSNAIIIDCDNRNTTEVSICSIVECEVTSLKNKSAKRIFFEIVGFDESDLKNNKISYNSPVGKCLMGLKKGDIKEIDLPIDKFTYKIVQFFNDWTEIKK